MKTRNGFVSNSSSSSFIIVCTLDDHKKALENLHPYYRAWVEQLAGYEESVFLGREIVIVTAMEDGDSYSVTYDGEIPEEVLKWYDPDDFEGGSAITGARSCLEAYHKALKAVTGDIVYNEESF